MLITRDKEIEGYNNYPSQRSLSLYEIQYCVLNKNLDKIYYKVNVIGRNISTIIENLRTIIPSRIISYEYNRVFYDIHLIDKKIIEEINDNQRKRLKDEMKEKLKDEIKKLTDRIIELKEQNNRLLNTIEQLKQKIV